MSEQKLRKAAKIFGYLEKRGKMTITGRWKRWWCVLEGHLLLYYKSQTEYLKLSPCCGSLNVALVRSIQPNTGCQLHILTHSQLVILRTRTKEKQQQWFHALVTVLPHNDFRRPMSNNFSFISLELHRKLEKRKTDLNGSAGKKFDNYSSQVKDLDLKQERENYDSNFNETNTFGECKISSETNNPDITILTEIQNIKAINLLRYHKNMKIFNLKKEIQPEYLSPNDEKLRKCPSCNNINNLSSATEVQIKKRSSSCDCIFFSHHEHNSVISENCTKSDNKNTILDDTILCLEVNEMGCQVVEENLPEKISRKLTKKNLFGKRSLSFLKNILLKKKYKYPREEVDEHYVNKSQFKEVHEDNLGESSSLPLNFYSGMQQEQLSGNSVQLIKRTISFPVEKKLDLQETLTSMSETNDSVKIEESKSWTMVHCDDFSQTRDMLPNLPVKKKINSPSYNLRKECTIITYANEHENKNSEKNVELDTLLLQLTTLNKHPNDFSEYNSIEDPDYDTPRPHLSLINKSDTEKILTNTKEHFEESSENLNSSRFNQSFSLDMAPDSLEMTWPSNKQVGNFNYWSTANDYHHFCLEKGSESDNDDIYQDSLNPIKHVS